MPDSLILRASARYVLWAGLALSVFVLLRGHNEPGGGFIGGLIAAAAIAIYGIASGPMAVRRAMRASPLAFAGAGVLLASLAGLLSLPFDLPFLTGLWTDLDLDGTKVAISTPMIFDIGVYLVVFGTISAIALGLEDEEGED